MKSMNENVQLIRFDGIWLITEIEQIPDTEFGSPDCVLRYPYELEGSCLGVFPHNTLEREFIVRSANISLITDPAPFLYNQYIELIAQEQTVPIDEEIEE